MFKKWLRRECPSSRRSPQAPWLQRRQYHPPHPQFHRRAQCPRHLRRWYISVGSTASNNCHIIVSTARRPSAPSAPSMGDTRTTMLSSSRRLWGQSRKAISKLSIKSPRGRTPSMGTRSTSLKPSRKPIRAAMPRKILSPGSLMSSGPVSPLKRRSWPKISMNWIKRMLPCSPNS